MESSPPAAKLNGLLRPTEDTKYHIDYTWWDRSHDDLRGYLLTHLPQDQRDAFRQIDANQVIDHIDPDTGEVFRMDALQLAIQNAAKAPDFINQHTSVVDGIFRVFLANHNTPLSPNELASRVSRPASTILRTLSGARVYNGIRPTEG